MLACGGSSDPEDDGSGGSGGGGGSAQMPDFPCDVGAIVRGVCARCHGPMPEGVHVGPMPLTTWEDTQREYFGKPVHVRMRDAIATNFMPLTAPPPLMPPVVRLSDDEKDLMLDWLDEGAKPAHGVVCD